VSVLEASSEPRLGGRIFQVVPTFGRLAGGDTVTVIGLAIGNTIDIVTVSFGNIPARIVSQACDNVVVETPRSNAGTTNVTVLSLSRGITNVNAAFSFVSGTCDDDHWTRQSILTNRR
jgi:hypothetical protein